MADRRSVTSAENGKKGGRPKGSTVRPQFRDFATEEQAHAVISALYADALEGKTDAQKYFLDQFYGKAVQRQEFAGEEGGPIQFALAEAIMTKNHLNDGSADTETD